MKYTVGCGDWCPCGGEHVFNLFQLSVWNTLVNTYTNIYPIQTFTIVNVNTFVTVMLRKYVLTFPLHPPQQEHFPAFSAPPTPSSSSSLPWSSFWAHPGSRCPLCCFQPARSWLNLPTGKTTCEIMDSVGYVHVLLWMWIYTQWVLIINSDEYVKNKKVNLLTCKYLILYWKKRNTVGF